MACRALRFVLVLFGAALIGVEASATTIAHRGLMHHLRKADFVFVAQVVHVDLVDGQGAQILDPEAGTGPGLRNTLRLHLVRSKDGMIYSRSGEEPPTELIVPLWPMWHMSLEWQQRSIGRTSIFIVTGPPWALVYPGGCILDLERRAHVEETLALLRELLESVGGSLERPLPSRTPR